MKELENLYFDINALSKYNDEEKQIYTFMYRSLIKYSLNPMDVTNYPKSKVHNLPQTISIKHLLKNLIDKKILVDKRTNDINTILEE